MGTCVSKCYPCFHCHPIPSNSTAGIHPHPHPHPLILPGEAAAATASTPTTTSSSVSLVASTSSSGSSSSSSAASSSYSWLWRPNTTSSSSSSMSSRDREWDVVVLDPKSKSSHSDRCKPIISGSGRHRLASNTPKRARSVSPLSARPAPGSYHKKTRNSKTEVSQQSLRRRRLLEAKTSSSAHADAAAPARVTAEDDLTNPIISMDCFIFL